MPSIDRAKFKEFSAKSLGVESSQLAPNVDTIEIAEQYCRLLEERLAPPQLADLNAMLDKLAATPVGVLLADAKTGPIARSIMKLWLLGAWYAPETPATLELVVSSQAYKEGLAWRAMQSHPMGYSMLPFEHWTKPPEPLEQFFKFAP